MKNIKIGWIGSGFVGQVAHLNSFYSLPNVKIVALSELREKLGRISCKRYNIENYYSNYQEMIDKENLDAVVAIVRRHHTAPIAKNILNSKNNLFTEKPMAMNLQQAKLLNKISSKNNLLYCIGNMRRFDSNVQNTKKILLKNNFNLGDLISFNCFCYAGYDYCNVDGFVTTNEPPPNKIIWPYYPDWLKKKFRLEYEKFLTYFVHDFNLINYFFDETPKINVSNYSKNGGTINFKYNKFFGNFNFGYLQDNRWEEGIEFNFTKGKIVLHLTPAFLKNKSSNLKIIYFSKGKSFQKEFKPDYTWSFKNQAIDFVSKLRKKEKNSISSGINSLKDYKLIEEIWRQID